MIALGGSASAQAARDCTAGDAGTRAAETRALIASMGVTMDRHQAELDAGIRDAVARTGWGEQERARFLRTLLRSDTNAGFDKRIAVLTAQLRGLLQALQRGDIQGLAAECQFVERVRERVGQLDSVHAQQSAFLMQSLRKAAPARRP